MSPRTRTVDVDASPGLTCDVRTASGNVRVFLAPGLVLDVDATTVSGTLSSEIDIDVDGEGELSEDTLRLRVRTVSGDVMVARR